MDFAQYRRAVLESSVTLFGWESLVVMWMAQGDFTEGELSVQPTRAQNCVACVLDLMQYQMLRFGVATLPR